MILFKKEADLRHWIVIQREKKYTVGFVPTMGALHKGHISLLESARKENTVTVCSIFVNPTQFNDPKDFEKYPITLEKDISLLEAAGSDVLFLPSVQEIYPGGLQPARHYELGKLETILEGKYRPGHFQGVCRVVHRLLEIVMPDRLYLGQKDYQQCMVIAQLIRLLDLPVNVTICPTLREEDGLAMSSRNMRLTETERKKAATIHAVLMYIKNEIRPGPLDALKTEAVEKLQRAGFRPDYVEIAAASDLSTEAAWDGRQQLVALVAAFLDEVRLIDNLLLDQ